MDLPKPPAPNDKDIRQETIRDLIAKEPKAILTQSKKGEELVAMLTANKKGFEIMRDEIMQADTEKIY